MKLLNVLSTIYSKLFYKKQSLDSVQEIFDKVIDNGYYTSIAGNEKFKYSNYMCYSLKYAYEDNIITKKDFFLARKEIEQYIGMSGLESVLSWNRLPSNYDDRLKIYRNWEDKPVLRGCRFYNKAAS